MKTRTRSLACVVALLGSLGVASPGAAAAANYDAAGPYPFKTVSNTGPFNSYTIVRPRTLGENGFKHPIITWGNGIASNPWVYSPMLDRLASHGFVVIAPNGMASSREDMIRGMEWLIAQNTAAGSEYNGKLNTEKIGAAGHSWGGGATINTAADKRITAAVPIEPAPPINAPVAPVLLLCGGLDFIISPALLCGPFSYMTAREPIWYGIHSSSTHFTPTILNGYSNPFMAPTTAWFKYFLMDDQEAKSMFFPAGSCTLCKDPLNWSVQMKNW